MELKKMKPTGLRLLGLDEKWLQDRLAEDASMLGLGELEIIRKEKIQPTGPRRPPQIPPPVAGSNSPTLEWRDEGC